MWMHLTSLWEKRRSYITMYFPKKENTMKYINGSCHVLDVRLVMGINIRIMRNVNCVLVNCRALYFAPRGGDCQDYFTFTRTTDLSIKQTRTACYQHGRHVKYDWI